MTAPAPPNPPVSVSIRPMRVSDIGAVERVEARSLPHPWPKGAYRHELEVNPHARFVVAALAPVAGVAVRADAAPGPDGVIGFAGLWMQHDEAHLGLMAVDPAYRRHGIGARLVARMLDEAIALGAACMTLEVRAGNAAAQRLYARFGFQVVGERHAYYPDNDEDAWIMTTPPLGDRAWRERFDRIRARLARGADAASAGHEHDDGQHDEGQPGGEEQVGR
ncbi:ribosomal-protein-alanine N-acetyltransferase [bacterium]|nr:ribosomal-protein-alanine N-acetyltransferase [Chloroflexi bacterium CFX6]RIL08249.1 MAG: ribosomal-protein-alanine N-acetyltransferase [bacterium]